MLDRVAAVKICASHFHRRWIVYCTPSVGDRELLWICGRPQGEEGRLRWWLGWEADAELLLVLNVFKGGGSPLLWSTMPSLWIGCTMSTLSKVPKCVTSLGAAIGGSIHRVNTLVMDNSTGYNDVAGPKWTGMQKMWQAGKTLLKNAKSLFSVDPCFRVAPDVPWVMLMDYPQVSKGTFEEDNHGHPPAHRSTSLVQGLLSDDCCQMAACHGYPWVAMTLWILVWWAHVVWQFSEAYPYQVI